MRRYPPGRDDVGASTVLAAIVCGVLVALGGGLGALAAVVVDLRTAQAAADLAALAGAGALARGQDACAAAAAVARANDATATSCATAGREVRLEVRVAGPHWWGLVADPTAEARAGPVGLADQAG